MRARKPAETTSVSAFFYMSLPSMNDWKQQMKTRLTPIAEVFLGKGGLERKPLCALYSRAPLRR